MIAAAAAAHADPLARNHRPAEFSVFCCSAREARAVLRAARMRTNLLFVTALLVSACGGEVAESTTETGPQSPAQSGGQNNGGGSERGETTTDAPDVPADANDVCSIARPGEAKALPAGVTVPANVPGLRLTFKLQNQLLELTEIRERGVAPAWISKDTQIFAADTTSGDWVETRDAAGTLTYQGGVFDPLGRTIEAAPDPNDPNSHWQNTEVCSATAEFDVEVPGDAVEVRFYGNELSSRPTALFAWYRLR